MLMSAYQCTRWIYWMSILYLLYKVNDFIQFSFSTHTMKLLPLLSIFYTLAAKPPPPPAAAASVCLQLQWFRRDRLRLHWRIRAMHEKKLAMNSEIVYRMGEKEDVASSVQLLKFNEFIRSFVPSFGFILCTMLINLHRQRNTIVQHTITASWIPWKSSSFKLSLSLACVPLTTPKFCVCFVQPASFRCVFQESR